MHYKLDKFGLNFKTPEKNETNLRKITLHHITQINKKNTPPFSVYPNLESF